MGSSPKSLEEFSQNGAVPDDFAGSDMLRFNCKKRESMRLPSLITRENLLRVPITLHTTLNWLLSIFSNKMACFPSNLLTTAASSNFVLTSLLILTSSRCPSKSDRKERKSLLVFVGFFCVDLFVLIEAAFTPHDLYDLIHDCLHVFKLQLPCAMKRCQANTIYHGRNSL